MIYLREQRADVRPISSSRFVLNDFQINSVTMSVQIASDLVKTLSFKFVINRSRHVNICRDQN